MKLTVVHLEGSKQGLTETLSGDVISIGRDPSNTLSFDPFKDVDVSTRHASIMAQGQQVVLQDLGSTNGTFLNDARVTAPTPLPNGCMVRFGESGPKVQLTYALHEGPGKKTKMIHDLSARLEEEERARKKGKSKLFVFGCCALLALAIGGGGFQVWSSIQAAEALRQEVAALADKARDEQALADNQQASTLPDAKEDWDAAVAALEAGAAAEAAEDHAAAKAEYARAIELFDRAGKKAGAAAGRQVAALRAELQAELERKAAEAEEARKKRATEEAALREEIEAKRRAELESFKAHLEEVRSVAALKVEVNKILASNNPQKLSEGVAAVNSALGEVTGESEKAELEPLLVELKAKLEEHQKTPARLEEAASKTKAAVFGIESRVFALPKGQRPDTTKLRYPVAEGRGTGFLVSAKGHVVTAKEVVEPHLFDTTALARKAKLEEKGMALFTEVTLFIEVEGAYTKSFEGDAIKVARRLDDSWGEPQKVTIEFDNAQVEVEVQPHRRDEAALVFLKVEGLEKKSELLPIPAFDGDVDAGHPLVALGTQQAEEAEGAPAGLALFMFEGKVSGGGKVLDLEVPSFSSWIGGPVIDTEARTIGVLVAADVATSKAVASSVFAEIVAGFAGD